MFIPFDLVALLLGKDLMARAYLLVYPLLEENNLMDACHPLVEFLQVASTQPNSGNPRPVMMQDWLGKVDYPLRMDIIHQCLSAVIYHLLPTLAPTRKVRLPDTFTEKLAEGLTHIAVEMHADRRTRETRFYEYAHPNNSRERYGERITDGILLMTASAADDLLPPFYQELGGKQNGES
jgi:hypothetical protein